MRQALLQSATSITISAISVITKCDVITKCGGTYPQESLRILLGSPKILEDPSRSEARGERFQLLEDFVSIPMERTSLICAAHSRLSEDNRGFFGGVLPTNELCSQVSLKAFHNKVLGAHRGILRNNTSCDLHKPRLSSSIWITRKSILDSTFLPSWCAYETTADTVLLRRLRKSALC